MLTQEQIEGFERDGFVVCPDLISVENCEALRGRAAEMMDELDESTVASTFDTTGSQARNEYFLDSGYGVGFFWEVEAVNDDRPGNSGTQCYRRGESH